MAEEIKKVITIDTKGAESVKDLIDKVEKLRSILKTLDETSDEYKTTLGELKSAQDSLSSSLGENKTKAEAAEGSYNALAKQMKDLKKEWKATSDEAERNALGKEIKSINDQLKTLDQSIGNNQRNVGNYAGSFQSLKQEIREARDIMAGAARGSDEYAAAAKRAADAADQLKDMQMEISNGASGLDNQFSVMTNMLGSVSGGFAAVQGAMALFGAESENLQKTFVKLQAAMSMTQGLKALAELPKGLNAAKIAFGGVTTGVRNFVKSLNLVKGAIAATGIGLLLVLLGELIAHWDEVTEAVSNFVGGLDHLKEVMAGVGNSIGEFIMGPVRALDLALQKDFKGAWDAFKNGWKFAQNYAVGVQNQMIRNQQKATQTQIELEDERLRDYIEDMEAQKKADWKYSAEGIDAYRKYHLNRLKMFKEGTEEYKKAQREMWSYERDLKEWRDRQKSGGSGGSGNSGKSEADEEAKALEERRKAAVEAYEKLVATETSEEEKLHKENLAKLKDGLELRSLTQEQYNEGMEAEEKRHNDVLKGIAEKSAKELSEAALKALAETQSVNERELNKYRAFIARNMFPAQNEVELEAKRLTGELSKALTEYGHRNKFSIGDFVIWDEADFETIEDYLKAVQGRILDLNNYLNDAGALYGAEFEYIRQTAVDAAKALEEIAKKQVEYENAVANGASVEHLQQIKSEIQSLGEEYRRLTTRLTDDDAFKLDKFAAQQVQSIWGWWTSFFDWRVNKGEDLVKEEMHNNNLELASFIATSEERIRQINEELLTQNLAEDEKLKLLQEVEELKRQEIEKTAEIEQRNADITLETIRKVEEGKKQLVAKTAEAIGNTGNFLMNWSDNIVKNETKNGEKMSKEKQKQAETMFNVGKGLAIGEAVVSTIQGAQEAYTSLAGIPYVGPALGIAAAAAAITAGMLRVQQITSQKFGEQGNLSDAGSSVGITSAVAVPQLESNPYQYTSNVTNAQDEDELNKPIIVQVSDVEDAMKVRESRSVETSF